MIDIHSHLLYGIDDGSRSIVESAYIIKSLSEIGYTDIILTPHFINGSSYMSTRENNLDLLEKLKVELIKHQIPVNLDLGNEIYIDSDIIKLFKEGIISSLNDTKYLLIELPMSGENEIYYDVFLDLINMGYKVILAHPERYISFQKDFNKVFGCNVIDRTKEYNQVCLKSAGIVTHFERDGNLDKIYYINENLHTLLVGSTGSGKSRSVIIPTITMLGLAGENMCISDVKGELYLYTAENLKKIGYDVIAIDYINFLKSNKYNYLDIIINAVEQDNIPLAESLINDLVNILVEKNEKTEPIWKNGEMSVIKTAIMAVVLENKGRREYQTLPNAYYFVAEMFKERNGKMPIDEYMAKKEANDPIKKFFAIARYSPTENKSKFCCCCTIYTSNVCR